ncbi:transcription factor TFIIE subunit TFA1 PWA37_000261 [Arxiozyma heterogenica]|uniref:transcription factor TFIIE subunit TFA1 n=1 Tax=Arxiozyma heterogenica TaxID=278026 RepID=UPI002F0F43C6
MDRPIDEIVRNLLKFVVRGFYGGSYVLVLDAIIFHSVLAEEDLKQLLSINKTELGPLIARLRGDRLITTHKQREYPPNSKSVERVYYYIKYPQAIDGIKWKVHQVVQRLKDDLDKNSVPNGYMCPICETKYTQLEAVQLLNFDRTEFLCSLCEEPLIEDDSGKKNKEKQDKLNRLMDQIQPVIDYLKKIDDSRIEENSFEYALARLIPPQNQSHAAYTFNPKKGSTMFRPGETNNAPLGNENSRRAGINSQATLHVNITTASDEMAQRQLKERQAEEKRKQNAVPEWHKQSTIGKTALGRLDEDEEFNPETTQQAAMSLGQASYSSYNSYNNYGRGNGFYGGNNKYYNNRKLTESELEERENERTLADYYAKLAKQQAEKQKRQAEKSEDENDELELLDEDNMVDEFEDVESTNKEAKLSEDIIPASLRNNIVEEVDEDEFDDQFDDEFEDVDHIEALEESMQEQKPTKQDNSTSLQAETSEGTDDKKNSKNDANNGEEEEIEVPFEDV